MYPCFYKNDKKKFIKLKNLKKKKWNDYLKEWNFRDYTISFKKNGFDRLDSWKYLNFKILTNDCNMSTGHAYVFLEKRDELLKKM